VPSLAAQLVSVTYLVEVLDENMNAPALPKPYWLKIDHEPERLDAGKPVTLSLSVWSREMGRLDPHRSLADRSKLRGYKSREYTGRRLSGHRRSVSEGYTIRMV
jgi:hypothetical protein